MTPLDLRGEVTHTHIYFVCFLKCISCVIVLKKTRSVTELKLIIDSKIFGYMHRAYCTMSAATQCQSGRGSECVPKPCHPGRILWRLHQCHTVCEYAHIHIPLSGCRQFTLKIRVQVCAKTLSSWQNSVETSPVLHSM